MPHPAHDCPPLIPASELKAQQESQSHRAANRNLWTTRAANAPLWTTRGTPGSAPPSTAEVLLPAYLAPPGAQQGTAGTSSENGSGSCRGGDDVGPPFIA